MARLFGNWSTPPWITATRTANLTIGAHFTVLSESTVNSLHWYAHSTLVADKPVGLRLIDLTTGGLLYGPTAPATPTVTGWQTVPITSLITLPAGHSYAVAWDLPNGAVYTEVSLSANPGQEWPLAFVAPELIYQSGGSGYGNNLTNSVAGFTEALDVDVTETTPTTSPSLTDVNNALDAWLVEGTENGHKDTSDRPGLPYTTKQDTEAIRAQANGASGFDAIKAVADAVASAVSGLPGTIASAVTTITDQTLTYLTAVQADLAGIINTGITSLTTLGTTILNDASGNFGGASGALSGRSGFPTELWTLVDEGDFDGDVAIAVAADLYALTIDVGTSGLVATPVAGVNWYPRAGWWCLLNGTFAAERHYFDFANVHLTDQGRRMPGALIHCRAGCSGHWQAWSLT